MSVRHVAVVGGGIAGLAAAHYLARRDDAPRVTLFESSPDLGGKVRTRELDGIPVEVGADAVLVRDDDFVELCRRVGLEDELIEPDVFAASIWSRGRLHPLPEGTLFGVPSRLGPLLRSGLVTTGGVVRAALDLVLPRAVDVDDASVADLVERRFGTQVAERLVDPLLSGVYAGDISRLSVTATAPSLAAAARDSRSVLLGLRGRHRTERTASFRSVRRGLGSLVEALAGTTGVDIRRGDPVHGIRRRDGRYVLRGAGKDLLETDGLVLAVPAFAAAGLVDVVAPDAPALLRAIPYASVAVVTLVYPPGTADLAGSGFLVPRVEERTVKAATYVSEKWASRMPDDRIVIRASVGRHGAEQAGRLDDDELVPAVHGDLGEIVGLRAPPVLHDVQRWERSMPQYEVGHSDRLEAIRDAVSHLPAFALVGAAYGGIGVAACIHQARTAAERLVASTSRQGGT